MRVNFKKIKKLDKKAVTVRLRKSTIDKIQHLKRITNIKTNGELIDYYLCQAYSQLKNEE